LVVLAVTVAAVGTALGLFASFGGTPPPRSGNGIGTGGGATPTGIVGHLVLRADGIGAAHFGQTESVAIANLDRTLGSPTSATPTRTDLCNIDASLQWPTIEAFFYHQHFVGYATGDTGIGTGTTGGDGTVTTSKGLRIGDTAVEAHRLYAAGFRESGVNGGVWSIATSSGTFRGYLSGTPQTDRIEAIAAGNYGRIATIEAGNLGCPAVAPGGP
jgi:hypothetical protein